MSQENQQANRRRFLQTGVVAGVAGATANFANAADPPNKAPASNKTGAFSVEEKTIDELQTAMRGGKITSRQLTQMYLDRIEVLDRRGPQLNSVVEINPAALQQAADEDKSRKRRIKGPLHGIPVLIKDNIGTSRRTGMLTTAGSLALMNAMPPRDASVVRQLRSAGAVILGKTNMSEWAAFRATLAPMAWSARGGITKNPNALDRTSGGSSCGSGAAVAASLCAVAIGTDTSGSIVLPSSVNGTVGIRPTLGLVSRDGIVPLALSQDTAGPMARTVRDAAILLGVLTGRDNRDKVTIVRGRKVHHDYTKFLNAKGLKGKKIGVIRQFCGFHEKVDALLEEAIGVMKKQGATVRDVQFRHKIDTPTQWAGGDEAIVLDYEFKDQLNHYLAQLKPRNRKLPRPPQNLKEVIAFNEQHQQSEMMAFFGQDYLKGAEKRGKLSDFNYKAALNRSRLHARTQGIDEVMRKHKLDALIAPTEGPAWLNDLVNGDHMRSMSVSASAMAGYPSISVPMGHVFGLPVGLTFMGGIWSEPTLLTISYAFEQATRFRRPPRFLTTANLWG